MALIELLAAAPTLWIGLAGVLGLLIGSFLNVVIHRLPLMLEREWRCQCAELLEVEPPPESPPLNLWWPPSRCPSCDQPIRAGDNIPVFSFLMLGGRCRNCRAPISLQYPLVEALSGVLAAVTAWQLGFGPPAAAALALTWTLIALSGIDFKHQLLPDCITLPVLWAGLGLALFGVYTDLPSAVIGAMAGYLSLWTVYQTFRLLTGREGMGRGDFKLLALLGAWLGWQALPGVILVSSLVGTVLGGGFLLLRGRDRRTPIPFGPFLALAGWIMLLWGDELNRWYLRGLGI